MNYERLARVIAKKHGVDPNVFVRQIRQESGFNPNAQSPAGARGIAQIMPATARSWGVNPDDPRAALNAAARNMAKYVKAYGSYRDALVAYNAGPGRVGKPLYAETANYVKRILPNGEPSKRVVRSGPVRSTPSKTVAGGVDPVARATALQQYLAQRGRPGALLALASGLEDAELPAGGVVAAPQSTERGHPSSGGSLPGSSGFLRGTRGKIIGTPGAGTHTLGNWQSDNAIDLGTPNGTIVTALGDGVVEKVRGGYSGGSSRFDGHQVTVRFADGNRAFYTHLSKTHMRPGMRVRTGQAIGRSGSANGVPHLHVGLQRGNPLKIAQRLAKQYGVSRDE